MYKNSYHNRIKYDVQCIVRSGELKDHSDTSVHEARSAVYPDPRDPLDISYLNL